MTEPANGPAAADETLILVVTQDCNLNCDYCPVEKKVGRMPFDVASKAIDVFLRKPAANRKIRFFGGEPLLEFPIVKKIVEYAKQKAAENLSFDITTNGVLLDSEIIGYFHSNPEIELIVSIDGTEHTHLLHRHGRDSYRWTLRLGGELNLLPNITVNKVVAPDTAGCLANDFLHIVKMGFERVNILPTYYVGWTLEQVRHFRLNLDAIIKCIAAYRRQEKYIDIKNLALTGDRPLFNRAMVVDIDGSCFSSNIFMHSGVASYREKFRVGDIWSHEQSAAGWADEEEALKEVFTSEILETTHAIDRELSGFLNKVVFLGMI